MFTTVEQIVSWPIMDGWHIAPNGNYVELGNYVKLGNDVKLGDYVKLGNDVKLGNGVKLGDYVELGNDVKLGNGVKLGDYVKLGNGVTSEDLAQLYRTVYNQTKTHIFWKWVTREKRMSPNFDGGAPIVYLRDAIVEADDAVASDQQCAEGLHVLRVGIRPEWAGLCSSDHNYIALEVEVNSEDILFAGLPGNDAKLRVRRLKVLT